MQYRIEYSYIENGQVEYEESTCTAYSVKEAIIATEAFYDDLEDFRIDRVWKDTGKRWEDVTPDWL